MKRIIENKKITLGILTMITVMAIIVVSSFFPFIIDLDRIGTNEFITDQMIIMAITITATISMMFVAQASNGANEKSEICKAKVEFKISMSKLINHTAFFQWVKRVLQKNDREDIAEKKMQELGIPYNVYLLENADILTLEKPQKIGDIFYKKLTKKQIKAVLRLKKDIAKIKFVSPSYYTSVKSMLAEKNLSQIASAENKKKIFTILFQLSLKILLSFIGAAILGSLVRDLTQEGGNTAQAWMRFLSRVFAYITSSFLGYTLGCKLNDIDAFYIQKRCEAHTMYLEDKNFKYVDEAKEEYVERVRQEGLLLTHKSEVSQEDDKGKEDIYN